MGSQQAAPSPRLAMLKKHRSRGSVSRCEKNAHSRFGAVAPALQHCVLGGAGGAASVGPENHECALFSLGTERRCACASPVRSSRSFLHGCEVVAHAGVSVCMYVLVYVCMCVCVCVRVCMCVYEPQRDWQAQKPIQVRVGNNAAYTQLRQ